jgi:septum formation protein
MHSPDLKNELAKSALDLGIQVTPVPFPYDLPLVLGTSSIHRKRIVDRLGWKYTQESPDIDGEGTHINHLFVNIMCECSFIVSPGTSALFCSCWSANAQLTHVSCVEKAIRCEDPLQLPILIAIAKASALLLRYTDNMPRVIITCDQVVLFEGKIREKPVDDIEASYFLSSYSDKNVSTVSALCITHYPSLVQFTGAFNH